MKLFHREIKLDVEKDDANMKVIAYLNDIRHEMRVTLVVEPGSMVIKEVAAEMIRAPYEVCREALTGVKALIGLQIKSGITRQLRELIGRTKGCVHINDLLGEAFKGAVQSDIQLQVDKLTGNSRYEKLEEILQGSCLRYTAENSQIK